MTDTSHIFKVEAIYLIARLAITPHMHNVKYIKNVKDSMNKQ